MVPAGRDRGSARAALNLARYTSAARGPPTRRRRPLVPAGVGHAAPCSRTPHGARGGCGSWRRRSGGSAGSATPAGRGGQRAAGGCRHAQALAQREAEAGRAGRDRTPRQERTRVNPSTPAGAHSRRCRARSTRACAAPVDGARDRGSSGATGPDADECPDESGAAAEVAELTDRLSRPRPGRHAGAGLEQLRKEREGAGPSWSWCASSRGARMLSSRGAAALPHGPPAILSRGVSGRRPASSRGTVNGREEDARRPGLFRTRLGSESRRPDHRIGAGDRWITRPPSSYRRRGGPRSPPARLPPHPRSVPGLRASLGKYHALVIGNDGYKQLRPWPRVHDARAVAAVLRSRTDQRHPGRERRRGGRPLRAEHTPGALNARTTSDLLCWHGELAIRRPRYGCGRCPDRPPPPGSPTWI